MKESVHYDVLVYTQTSIKWIEDDPGHGHDAFAVAWFNCVGGRPTLKQASMFINPFTTVAAAVLFLFCCLFGAVRMHAGAQGYCYRPAAPTRSTRCAIRSVSIYYSVLVLVDLRLTMDDIPRIACCSPSCTEVLSIPWSSHLGLTPWELSLIFTY